jgi:hypothetical protein
LRSHRLAVYVKNLEDLSCRGCEVVFAARWGGGSEYWLRCAGLDDLVDCLLAVARRGVIVGVGGADGRWLPLLPGDVGRLEGLSTAVLRLPAGSRVVVEYSRPEQLRPLLGASSSLVVNVERRRAEALLARELTTETTFDSGLRLLKPVRAPP